MDYLKLLRAQRTSRKPPTLSPQRLSAQQKQWADRGDCIQCGLRQAAANSYICVECQQDVSQEDIQKELSLLRKRILHHHGE